MLIHRFRGDLLLAMKRDCLFWPLRLDPKDREYDVDWLG